jgi:hypothetical protein
MIDKAQLDSYRALAAKPAHDSVDAAKALVALPVLLAEVDRLRQLVVELIVFADEGWHAASASERFQDLKAKAGL